MLSPRPRAACALLALLAACAAPSSSIEELGQTKQAITNGETDDDDPAVVALLVSGHFYCSGTLISPYIVVTAAHCVHPVSPEQVYFGSTPDVDDSGTIVDVAEAHSHPSYNEDSLTNDVGTVALKTAAPKKPKTRVAADALSDDDYTGLALRIVGFGATSGDSTSKTRKRDGDTTVDSLTSNAFKFKPNPSQTCSGDSGGAAFATVKGKEVLVGVTSAGDPACTDYGRDMRVDAYDEFIDGKIQSYNATLQAQQDAASGCRTAPGAGGGWLLPVLIALGLVRRRAPTRAQVHPGEPV